MTAEMTAVRAARVEAFGVNVFVPGQPAVDRARVEAYVASLQVEASELGVGVGAPTWDDDDYGAKVDALVARPPAAVSFTFGVPDAEVVRSLQAAGSIVLLTVTTPEEAAHALRVGPDALCLQGAEAGAHRGSLANDDRPDQDRPVRALLAAVRQHTLVPLVAAGGVGGPDDVLDLLARGADLVQAGTAFLRCPESGAHPAHKDALADPAFAQTAVTRAFSGRRARALANAMVRRPPRGARGLPRGQQRHATPAGRSDASGRRPAHEPLRRDGLPPGRGAPGPRGGRTAAVRMAQVSSRRETKTMEFTPPDVADVAVALAELRAAGSGWVNLLPGIDEDAVDVDPPTGLFAFFGNRAPPVTMATIMPPQAGPPRHRGDDGRAHAPDGGQGGGAPGRGRGGGARRMGGAPGPRPERTRLANAGGRPRGRRHLLVRRRRDSPVPRRDDRTLARRRLPSVGLLRAPPLPASLQVRHDSDPPFFSVRQRQTHRVFATRADIRTTRDPTVYGWRLLSGIEESVNRLS